MRTRILLLAKKNNVFCDYAEKIMYSYFKAKEIKYITGDGSAPFNEELIGVKPEYMISFLSPWILPEALLLSAQKAAINFHPGSPNYPGIGCYNFALYECAVTYGITCHHMKAKVDSGAIVMTSHFSISPHETVETLKLKSMNHMLLCFERILGFIAHGQPLPHSPEQWLRRPFTRKQLEELCYVSPNNTDAMDVQRRIKATQYPSAPHGAYTVVGNQKFYYPSENRPPII